MNQRITPVVGKNRNDFSRLTPTGSPRGWIALLGLAILVGLVAACSGQGDEADDSSSAAVTGRWTLPTAVKSAGAKVRIPYVNAPKWTSTKTCSGGLRTGGHVLGEFLMDKYAQVSSVGGYSCRRNTADSARMSVHGTGRALDVFIPMVKGGPDTARGDKVANWLVQNATSVGVQLIIWDRSMWRSNGTNEVAYGGPVPHIDHIHVEITEASAAKTKLWFSDPDAGAGDDSDAGTTANADAGNATTDTDSGDTTDDDDAGSVPVPDASTTPAVDASTTPAPDAATPPAADSGADDEPTTDTTETAPGADSAGDEPGEQSSLPDRPTSRVTPSADDEEADIKANAGCSAAPGSQSPLENVGLGLAFAMGFGVWLRKKKR